ncbi:SPI-1 type III secretion system effector E3 ubiquitin transferase SlrP, partial [Salmonella enterica]
PEEWREMMAKSDECIETDEYQSRVNAELEDLRRADDSDAERTTEVQMDAERAIGIKIREEINQTLFTEIMENILLKKEV